MDRGSRSDKFSPFLAPRSSSRACPAADSICGQQPPSWDGMLRCLLKDSGSADAPVALRAANVFFGMLHRLHVFRSVGVGATCSDYPGGVIHIYSLIVRATGGENH